MRIWGRGCSWLSMCWIDASGVWWDYSVSVVTVTWCSQSCWHAGYHGVLWVRRKWTVYVQNVVTKTIKVQSTYPILYCPDWSPLFVVGGSHHLHEVPTSFTVPTTFCFCFYYYYYYFFFCHHHVFISLILSLNSHLSFIPGGNNYIWSIIEGTVIKLHRYIDNFYIIMQQQIIWSA